MARIRTLKPEFWDHAQLNRASLLARLTFVGLISLSDDQGRGRADTTWLWGQLHSGQPPNVVRLWSKCLLELAQLKDDDGPLVIFYEVAGARYYWLPGFCRQQYIEKAGKSKLPEPPNSGNVPLLLPSNSPLEQGTGNREQGTGIREGNVGEPEGKGTDSRARRSGDPASLLASEWRHGFPINQAGGSRLVQCAIDRGAKPCEIQAAFWDEPKCKGKKIWEILDQVTPKNTNGSGRDFMAEIREKFLKGEKFDAS